MAHNELLLQDWQNAILEECKAKLGRDLTNVERRFITSRGGFLALEAIRETVKSAEKDQLEAGPNTADKARNGPCPMDPRSESLSKPTEQNTKTGYPGETSQLKKYRTRYRRYPERS